MASPASAPPPTPRHQRRPLVIGLTVLSGVALATLSWLLRDRDPWWSALLANMAVVVLLILPGEFLLSRLRSRFERVEDAADAAQATAQAAQQTADEAARSLKDVRSVLLDRQRTELEAELDLYRAIVTQPSRGSLMNALRRATEEGIITRAGVRAPVWETDVHYRFVVDDRLSAFRVYLEHDDGDIISSVTWESDAPSEDFYQKLVYAVRAAGYDLGTGLNDPTHSVQELSDMLVDVTKLRAQELAGHRETLRRIIERRDGWYFTEDNVIPAEDLHYCIAVNRLNELDWEEHLQKKGWYSALDAIPFARKLYRVDVKAAGE